MATAYTTGTPSASGPAARYARAPASAGSRRPAPQMAARTSRRWMRATSAALPAPATTRPIATSARARRRGSWGARWRASPRTERLRRRNECGRRDRTATRGQAEREQHRPEHERARRDRALGTAVLRQRDHAHGDRWHEELHEVASAHEPAQREDRRARAVRREIDERRDAQDAQAPSRSFSAGTSSAIGTRTCAIESRSRIVTCRSSSESKSTVTQSGVPISSWRR